MPNVVNNNQAHANTAWRKMGEATSTVLLSPASWEYQRDLKRSQEDILDLDYKEEVENVPNPIFVSVSGAAQPAAFSVWLPVYTSA